MVGASIHPWRLCPSNKTVIINCDRQTQFQKREKTKSGDRMKWGDVQIRWASVHVKQGVFTAVQLKEQHGTISACGYTERKYVSMSLLCVVCCGEGRCGREAKSKTGLKVDILWQRYFMRTQCAHTRTHTAR